MEGDNAKLKADVAEADRSVKGLDNSIKATDNSASSLFATLGKFFTAGAAIAGASWLRDVVEQQGALIHSMTETADIVGSTRERIGQYATGMLRAGKDVGGALSMLEQFNASLERNEERLAAVGVATRDQNGNFLDSLEILGDLKTAMAQMDAQQSAQLMRRLGLDPRMLQADISGENIFSPELMASANKFDEAMSKASATMAEIKVRLADIFLPLITWLNEPSVTNFLKDNIKPLVAILGAAGVTGAAAFIGIKVNALIASGAVSTFMASFAPLLPIVIGVGLLMAGFISLWNYLSDKDIRNTWLGAFERLFPNIAAVFAGIKQLFSDFIDWVFDSKDSMDYSKELHDIAYGFGFAFGYVMGWIDTLIGGFGKLGSAIIEATKPLRNFVSSVGEAIFDGAKGVIGWFSGDDAKQANRHMAAAQSSEWNNLTPAEVQAKAQAKNAGNTTNEQKVQNINVTNNFTDVPEETIRRITKGEIAREIEGIETAAMSAGY